MSKLLKAFIYIAYAIVVIQYLTFSLSSDEEIVELDYISHFTDKEEKAFMKVVQKYKKNLTAIQVRYRKPKRFPTDLKFILKHTNSFLHYGISLYNNGQSAFTHNNCKYINCYLTNTIQTLADLRYYDAILFDVENSWESLPALRHPHQNFVFVASESSDNFPLCDPSFNNYYNLTWSYKLDSDIPMTYIMIEDKEGNVVGPHLNMTWISPMKPISKDVKEKIGDKKKAAAWFVSNCKTKSGRGKLTSAIEHELWKYNLTIDIFGHCGRRTCPKDSFPQCLTLLEQDYYFYFAFENSLSEDYVTEKILHPLQHYTVPVVYGGANYSRFVPPGSYIDAKLLNASEVAKEMYEAIRNKTKYEDYFRWHNYYKYSSPSGLPSVCKLCEILNEKADKRSSYRNFLRWWNPKFMDTCIEGDGRVLFRDPHNPIFMEPHDLNRDPDIILKRINTEV